MYRTIRRGFSCTECVEGERVLYRQGNFGVMKEVAGTRRGERTGGFFNRYVYEFSDEATPYATRPPEPKLTWRLGFSRKGTIESEGFSGPLVREKILDQVILTFGTFEWRTDLSQHELYFDPPDPRFELRASMLAFCFYHLTAGD